MVSAEGEPPTDQIGAVLLDERYDSQELPTGDAVLTLRFCQ